MNKFRFSYSILNLWANGRKDDAIKAYFKLPQFQTQEMLDGIKFHEQWRAEIEKTKCLPEVFGGYGLVDPKTEDKMVVQINDWCEFVFIPDLTDDFTLTDFKTGTGELGTYLEAMQLPVYAIMLAKMGINVDRGAIRKYNQYEKKAEYGAIWITENRKKLAKDWLISNIVGMSDYIESEKLFEKFGKPKEIAVNDF